MTTSDTLNCFSLALFCLVGVVVALVGMFVFALVGMFVFVLPECRHGIGGGSNSGWRRGTWWAARRMPTSGRQICFNGDGVEECSDHL